MEVEINNMPQLLDHDYSSILATELQLNRSNVAATIDLLDNGSTVPFISRYRKEATGSLDEVAVTSIRDRLAQLRELDKRRLTVLSTIKEQGKLTEELQEKILAAKTMAILEDIYLPFKPKRRTRATVAKEKGLEPLAQIIFEQKGVDVNVEAAKYLNDAVPTIEDALAGARDIIAEWINENANARNKLRVLYQNQGIIFSRVIRGKEAEGAKYKDYFEWQEIAIKAPSHRILALFRGEKENILSVHVSPPEEEALAILRLLFVKGKGQDTYQVHQALEDGYKRLLSVSMETETRVELKKKADADAIAIFANNLRELLMSPPLGQKVVLGVDPGFRTGCKIVCLDAQGNMLENDAIFPTGSETQEENAAKTIHDWCKKYKVEVIAIGNGTASRETENFVRQLKLPKDIQIVVVNESGASIYSASDVAREEFPDHDVTVRGAVSIGRRLMDPLAELVKIDSKSIGVGQYQHDVDQRLLKQSLDDVVESCVNQVGVELNTASKQLLMYVSGLGPARAQAIVNYRMAHGPFRSREELKDVDGLGAKAIEQSAGFLRICDSENPLDTSAVHPESYAIVHAMASDLGCDVNQLMKNDALRKKIDLKKYITNTIGLPTLKDICDELAKPGRDPRGVLEKFSFKEGIMSLNDLKPGMKLQGIVTNVTAFGAFVDVGVHQDGLVHISQLSDKYVKDPFDVVKVQQKVNVTVLEIDRDRKRVALTMKK